MKSFLVIFVLFIAFVSCSTYFIPPSSELKPVLPEVFVETEKIEVPKTVVVEGGTKLDHIVTIDSPEGKIKVEEVPGQDNRTGDYSVKSNLKIVKQLADLGNCLVFKDKFYEKIKNHKQFDFTTDSSEAVSYKLSLYTPVVLTTYYKKYSVWPAITKTRAYRNVGSNVIYLNTYYMGKVISKDLLNTIWHERAHVVGYGHGDNYSNGKENSVNYATGEIAEEFYDECYNEVIK